MRPVTSLLAPTSHPERDTEAAAKRPAGWSISQLAGQILGCLPRPKPAPPTAHVPAPPLPRSQETQADAPQVPPAISQGTRRTLPAHLAQSQVLLSAVLNVDFFAQLAQAHPAGIRDADQLTAEVRAQIASPQAVAAATAQGHDLPQAARLARLLPTLVKVVAEAYRHHMHDLNLLQRQRARVELLLPLHLEGYIGRFARPLARQLAKADD